MKSKKKQAGVKGSATASNFQVLDSITAGGPKADLLKTHHEDSSQPKMGEGSVITGKGEVNNENFDWWEVYPLKKGSYAGEDWEPQQYADEVVYQYFDDGRFDLL